MWVAAQQSDNVGGCTAKCLTQWVQISNIRWIKLHGTGKYSDGFALPAGPAAHPNTMPRLTTKDFTNVIAQCNDQPQL